MRFNDPAEIRGAQVAALTSMLLIAQQVAGKAARDALFLSSFHSSRLPLVMASSAVLSLLSVYCLSRLMLKRTPATLLPVMFGLSACGFALEWGLAHVAPRAAALLVYSQTAALGPLLISTFWSLINERFDPRAAKRAVSRISGGGTLGGLLGGLAAWRASAFIEPITVLLFLALINALAVVGTLITRARREAISMAADSVAESDETEASPFTTLRDAPFLRNLALLVALGAAISSLLDYIFSAQAALSFGKGQPLLSFFSLFWLGVSVLSFCLQMAVGRAALEKLGLAINIAILPGIIALGGAFGLAMPGLASASMLRGAEAVQRNTLFRSAYELLYTPVSEAKKRATKAVIDVGCDRLGTVLGSGLALLVLHSSAQVPSQWLLGAVVVLALVTLPVTRRLHVGYVQALEQGLRERAAKLEAVADPGEADVKERLGPDSRGALQGQREELIERVEELQPGGLSALIDERAAELPSDTVADLRARDEEMLETARDLLSRRPDQVKRALTRLTPHAPGPACAILLLTHPEHCHDALQALRANAATLTGQLLDALLDPQLDFQLRRRIPRVLRACPTQRAADGLLLGIADERFEVRYECARALLKITDEAPALVISRAQVIEAIRREVESNQLLSDYSSAAFDREDDQDDERALVVELVRDRAGRSLEHLCTILSLVLEREPLRIAFTALHHDDDKYRGTALEYLDTVLPPEIRELIWPYLGEGAPLTTARPASELLAELARAVETAR
jgi:ATP:ADP antiporter, AAA family